MKTKLTLFLLLLATTFGLHSCTADDWAEFLIEDNAWRVTNVKSDFPQLPYRPGDMFYFYWNNRFEVRGSGGLYESGRWEVVNKHLLIHFDGQPGDVHIEAPMPVLHSWRMVLDCWDYLYNMEYELELSREYSLNNRDYYYSRAKNEVVPLDSLRADSLRADTLKPSGK